MKNRGFTFVQVLFHFIKKFRSKTHTCCSKWIKKIVIFEIQLSSSFSYIQLNFFFVKCICKMALICLKTSVPLNCRPQKVCADTVPALKSMCRYEEGITNYMYVSVSFWSTRYGADRCLRVLV